MATLGTAILGQTVLGAGETTDTASEIAVVTDAAESTDVSIQTTSGSKEAATVSAEKSLSQVLVKPARRSRPESIRNAPVSSDSNDAVIAKEGWY